MVGLFKVLPSLLLATFAAADLFSIYAPSATVWWVANSQNVFAWDCNANPGIQNFTVLINNVNPAVLQGPLAFIAILDYNICSYAVSQDQVNQTAGTGYTLIFGDIFNETNVYATSQQFEIRPLGSAYPTTTAVVSGGSTAMPSSSSSASGGSPSPSKAAALGAHNPSAIGLAGVMGLLVAAVLGA